MPQFGTLAHLSVGVVEDDAEVGHGPEDGHEGLDGVAVDDGPVLLEVLRREARFVNDLHLLHDRRLPGFSSACNRRKKPGISILTSSA